MSFDWDFVVRDCHGNLEAIGRRVKRALETARNEALNEAHDAVLMAYSRFRDEGPNQVDCALAIEKLIQQTDASSASTQGEKK